MGRQCAVWNLHFTALALCMVYCNYTAWCTDYWTMQMRFQCVWRRLCEHTILWSGTKLPVCTHYAQVNYLDCMYSVQVNSLDCMYIVCRIGADDVIYVNSEWRHWNIGHLKKYPAYIATIRVRILDDWIRSVHLESEQCTASPNCPDLRTLTAAASEVASTAARLAMLLLLLLSRCFSASATGNVSLLPFLPLPLLLLLLPAAAFCGL